MKHLPLSVIFLFAVGSFLAGEESSSKELPDISLADILTPFHEELESMTQEEFSRDDNIREVLAYMADGSVKVACLLHDTITVTLVASEKMCNNNIPEKEGYSSHDELLASMVRQLLNGLKQDATDLSVQASEVKKPAGQLIGLVKDREAKVNSVLDALLALKEQNRIAEDIYKKATEKAYLAVYITRRQFREIAFKEAGDTTVKLERDTMRLVEEFLKKDISIVPAVPSSGLIEKVETLYINIHE